MIDIDFDLLRSIGLSRHITSQLQALGCHAPGTRLARITEVQRDWLAVHDGSEEFRARALPRLLQAMAARDAALAVGDWVLAEPHPNGERWLAERLDPLTHIARRDNDGRRQSLASNVDTALLVMGLDHDFNPRRMERAIAMARAAEVAVVLVLTKADIGADVEERLALVARRLPPSVPVVTVNGQSAQAALALAPWLAPGQTLILLGSSGAGKSTLTNTLAASGQQTGGVRRGDGRGRHTTTARSLHLCAGGACIIDTPGLRSWRPDADEDALTAAFEDIDALARLCQFRDCGHDGEPGCAVAQAVDPDRLRNYRKLLREARRGQQTPLERIAERSRWKVVQKAAQVRNKRAGRTGD